MSISGRIAAFLILLAATFTWTAPTLGAQLPDTVVLVATPQFQDPVYGETILIAKSLENGQHVGFILNKPTDYSLADVFPKHEPSVNVRDPLYFGGPEGLNEIFALVQGGSSPGDGSVQIAPNLFLVITEQTLGQLIETDAHHARFFIGAVMWKPGELDEELKRGAWYVLEKLEPELLLRGKTSGLWQELVHRAEISANAI